MAVLWHLSSFSFLAFLWVFNSSLRALPIIYDILLLVRSSWKTCSYGNCCFQTGWFQLQNNIIKYATAHISFNGKRILMICTTKSENLNTWGKKDEMVGKPIWLSGQKGEIACRILLGISLAWHYLGKSGERSTGFEIVLSRELWPSWTKITRGGLYLGFDISLFLVHLKNFKPPLKSVQSKHRHWQHSTQILKSEYLLVYYSVIVCFLCPTIYSFQCQGNEGQCYHWVILPTESFVNQVTKTRSLYILDYYFFFCLLRDSHFLSLHSNPNFASYHGNIFEVNIILMFHHDLLWYSLGLL